MTSADALQSIRASFESYSLKKIEQFYRGDRNAAVTSAMGSVVAYENYLESRDPAELERIVEYNRDDCISTLDLHRWLLERKAQAEAEFATQLEWRPMPAPEAPKVDPELDGLAAQLAHGVDDPERAEPDDRARWLAAQLLSLSANTGRSRAGVKTSRILTPAQVGRMLAR